MNEPVKIFKALSDPTRLEIAVYLAKYGQMSCGELSKRFPLSQPTLSHHYKKLADAEIIIVSKDGASHFYQINHELLKEAGVNLKKIKD